MKVAAAGCAAPPAQRAGGFTALLEIVKSTFYTII